MPRRRHSGPLTRALMLHLVPSISLAAIHGLGASWRYRQSGREHFERGLAASRPLVGAFPHGRTFPLLRFMSRPGNGRWLAMCSSSVDGDAMARIEQRLGYEVVRGSTGMHGLQAIVDMVRRVRATPGLSACLAVDGSRGPRGRVQGGAVALARRTGGMILPITASARPAVILPRTWDRSLVPLPFARIDVFFGELLEIDARAPADEVERVRAELERRLVDLQARADSRSGFGDTEPARAQ